MQNDSLKNTIDTKEATMNQKIFTFLTFQKEDAEEALRVLKKKREKDPEHEGQYNSMERALESIINAE